MKKLIAGLMLLLMFVNAESAVKGVAPDAKTLAKIKERGVQVAEFVKTLSDEGFIRRDNGSCAFYYPQGEAYFSVDKDERFCFSVDVLKDIKTVVELWFDEYSGKIDNFHIKIRENNKFIPERINGYHACYSKDGSIYYLLDAKGNSCDIK